MVTCAVSGVPSRCNSPVRSPRQPGVRADYDAGELAQLRLPPVEIHMQGHLTERRRAANARLNADDSGFLLIKAYVGAGGLGAQANAPLTGVLLPERDIGADK